MIGDRVIPKPHHTAAAKEILKLLDAKVRGDRTAINIAGESGSGKSEIAAELARFFEDEGLRTLILAQDDYFELPPKTNEKARMKDIGRVGTSEVKIALLDAHLAAFKTRPQEPIVKPLVIFDEDRISEEAVEPKNFHIAIAEGTYTTLLENSDWRVFIDRTYVDTYDHRKERSREAMNEFYDRVMKIEHDIISKHKARANIIVGKDYSVRAKT